MADYINMQETEYDELQEKIALIHDGIEEGERTIREHIQLFVSLEGGFFVKEISEKITKMLSEMDNTISSDIVGSFRCSEQEIAEFVDSVKQADIKNS